VGHDPRHDRSRVGTFSDDRGTLNHGPTAFVATREARDHIANPLVVNHPIPVFQGSLARIISFVGI
jgi:hypothetical protein